MKKKVGVVTGSSKGIGKAIAITFAKSGEYSAVVTNARKMQEAQAVSDEIISLGCNSIPIEADISNEDDCIRLIEETVRNYVRIDVLVNNAGVQKEVALEETTLDVWQKILAVDLTGPFICSREAVKHMERQQDPTGGCIINISSVHQTIPKPHYIPYATSKAGIEMMTKTLASELAKSNIRANTVAPGAIETPMNILLDENEDARQITLKQIPMGRIGRAEEVANAVAFLASDKASYITGTTLYVDGGMTLYSSFQYNAH
jgi:glucose 1-dehydrogenase